MLDSINLNFSESVRVCLPNIRLSKAYLWISLEMFIVARVVSAGWGAGHNAGKIGYLMRIRYPVCYHLPLPYRLQSEDPIPDFGTMV